MAIKKRQFLFWIAAIAISGCIALSMFILWAFHSATKPFSYHQKDASRLDPPFSKPKIPTSAKDVHIELSTTLNESDLRIRFTDKQEGIDTFIHSLDYPLENRLLPVPQSSLCGHLNAPFNADDVRRGKSYFKDENQTCIHVVIDEETNTVYFSDINY